ncbi:FAD-dependent oxidoreductase, partial [Klebsiella variicola]
QFEQKGMKVLTAAVVQSIQIENEQVHCVVETANDVQTLDFDRVLSAIGVQPNTTGLGLERLGVELNPQGFVAIDDYCKTNVAGLYAIGDVAGA